MAKWRKYPRPVITPDERAALFELQGGKCALCGRDDVDLHIDHSRRTGKRRGLLCRTHNTALGMFHDSPKLLRKALQYLRKPPATQLKHKETLAVTGYRKTKARATTEGMV